MKTSESIQKLKAIIDVCRPKLKMAQIATLLGASENHIYACRRGDEGFSDDFLFRIETLLWLAEGKVAKPITPKAAITVDIENAQPIKIESADSDLWIRKRE